MCRNSGLEPALLDLVKVRASQINGCAYCIHMHTGKARARGESEERIYLLDAWRESPLYTERERAALAWTEALTLVSQTCPTRSTTRRGGSSPRRSWSS
jgi:AhpD family alkylhydroperoxidase